MNSYELSRKFFDWTFENPEKVTPNHIALYFFCIEHCNRLGWKQSFGLPTTMAKEAIGIRSYNTYIKTLNDLVEFGFIKLIEKSKNQYSSNIIALSNYTKALDKALDKAFIKHDTKQSESTIQSIDSIDKPITINNKQLTINNTEPSAEYFKIGKEIIKEKASLYFKKSNQMFLEQWLMKNKDPIKESVFEKMDLDYLGYEFNNNNHLQNTFRAIWNKLINEKNNGKSTNTREQNRNELNELGKSAIATLLDKKDS